jgi:hypothetical protein
MSVHQCPRCPLRFSYRTELEFHLREDHHPAVDAAASGPTGEPDALQPLPHLSDGRPDQLVAASASAASARPPVPRSSAGPSAFSWPDVEPDSDAHEDKAGSDFHSIDRPLPPVTLMPRWVVVVVIALVVAMLGLGLVLSS